MMSPSEARLEILADPEALSRRVAAWILELVAAEEGVCAVALSGGSTPRQVYHLLAGPPDLPRSDANTVCPSQHPIRFEVLHLKVESKQSHAPIPAGNIHPIPTEGVTCEAAASVYERELNAFYGAYRLDPDRPLFDVTLLGLGPDGHTASLFPGGTVLAERDRWVAAVGGAKTEVRITLTYPALESSRHAAILVTGEDKRAIFGRLRRGDDSVPAARLHPIGTLWIFADMAAGTAIG